MKIQQISALPPAPAQQFSLLRNCGDGGGNGSAAGASMRAQ